LEQEKINCSVGIAPNKFIAKLASTASKPNGLLEIPPEKILDFLHPLPVGAMWGVGEKTEIELHSLGLRTVGDIAKTSEKTLIRALGAAVGKKIYQLANGEDDREIEFGEAEKSISNAETFAYDLDNEEEILRELLRLTTKAAHRMRARGYVTQTINIKVRFADFRTISKSKTTDLPLHTNAEIYEVVKKLYKSLNLDRVRVRLVSVGLERLLESNGAPQQLELGAREKGWNEVTGSMDAVEARFGNKALRPARLISPKKDGKNPKK
jgi:DNA polymerase-4